MKYTKRKKKHRSKYKSKQILRKKNFKKQTFRKRFAKKRRTKKAGTNSNLSSREARSSRHAFLAEKKAAEKAAQAEKERILAEVAAQKKAERAANKRKREADRSEAKQASKQTVSVEQLVKESERGAKRAREVATKAKENADRVQAQQTAEQAEQSRRAWARWATSQAKRAARQAEWTDAEDKPPPQNYNRIGRKVVWLKWKTIFEEPLEKVAEETRAKSIANGDNPNIVAHNVYLETKKEFQRLFKQSNLFGAFEPPLGEIVSQKYNKAAEKIGAKVLISYYSRLLGSGKSIPRSGKDHLSHYMNDPNIWNRLTPQEQNFIININNDKNDGDEAYAITPAELAAYDLLYPDYDDPDLIDAHLVVEDETYIPETYRRTTDQQAERKRINRANWEATAKNILPYN